MQKVKTLLKNEAVISGLLCTLLAVLSFAFFIIKGQGVFSLRADFNMQQIPFTVALHNALFDGGIGGWNWNIDIGSSTLQSFSFYELGSPFFWISMLFPANAFPYIVAPLYILKYALAGVTACLYFKGFVKDSRWAVVGALLYAFSGFSCSNLLFYHFHDVVAFFPLLLLGIEKLVQDNNKVLFILSVAMNCLVNYFFFVGEAVFLVIYFLFRFWNKDIKQMVQNALKVLICAVWGIGIAAVLFVPSIYYVLGSPRTDSELFLSNIVKNSRDFLYLMKAYLLPGEAMHDQSSIFQSEWSSNAAYIPVFGISFALAYVSKKRDWLERLLIFLFLMSLSPLLYSSFLLFTEITMRWLYMFILPGVLATIRVLDEKEEYNINLWGGISIAITLLFFALIRFVDYSKDTDILFDGKKFLILTVIAVCGLIIAVIIPKFESRTYDITLLVVSVFAVVTTALTIHYYRIGDDLPKDYYDKFMVGASLPAIDDQYRYNCEDNILMIPSKEAAGFACFTSTNSNAISRFEDLFGYCVGNWAISKTDYEGIAALLGGKYYISEEVLDMELIKQISYGNKLYYIYDMPANPIGYAVDDFMTIYSLYQLPDTKRALALLSATTVTDEWMDVADTMMNRITENDVNLDRPIEEMVAINTANKVNDFKRDGKGFSCTTNYDRDRAVYFSVPCDEGWTATIDGNETQIIDAGGMMLIYVPMGAHSIEFSYLTPGYHLGIVISCVSLILFVGMIAFERKRRVKK